MAETETVRVPDIGDFESVDVIEVLVSVGDTVAAEDGLITLESEKASMDVPSPSAGTVKEVKVSAGDKVAQGDEIVLLEVGEEGEEEAEGKDEKEAAEDAPEEAAEAEKELKRPVSAPAGRAGGPTSPVSAPADTPTRAPAQARDAADLHAEVLVLGSGPGGYTAAFRAADLGRKVVLVERYPTLGGVCLNVGCIPSKALLHAAKVVDEAREMGERGIRFGEPEIDLDALRSWKDSVVGKLTAGLASMAKRREVTVVRGTGTFASPHTLTVDGEDGTKTVSFDAAIVAAGSRVMELPGIPLDDPRVLDSTRALELREVPERLLVVGGGIIGLEMASVYAALGSRITVVELLDRLMAGADPDIVKPLRKRIEPRYEAIHLETKVAEVKAQKNGLKVRFEAASEGGEAPEPKIFDAVLVAVGRRPNGDRIGAEAAGLEVDDRGFLRVDERQRTNVPHIYAIGDIVGQPLLAHKASHQGKVAAEVASGERSAFDARVVPSVAYTDPEVAWAGVTEEEAKERGIAYGKGTFPWSASGRSLGLGRDEGMTKLLFEEETGRLLGAGIVGPNAGDLISEVALAIEMGCVAADIGLTIHPHPTLSETVAFAAEAFEGTLTELYKPKRRK
jgi:dihydrolipoamide dehydrogenase